MSSFDSPFYPYEKVIVGANTLRGAEEIPHKILTYLLDLPDSNGYTPQDDNNRPRVRLVKYLIWDGERPLEKRLPTPAEKLSILFDANAPVVATDEEKQAHPFGYRLFMQRVIGQSITEAKTLLKCYIDRTYERRKFVTTIGITVEIWCNVNYIANTKTTAYDRSFDIEQCLREALDGVNLAGIGTVSFSRADDTNNGGANIYNEASETGRVLRFSLDWSDGATEISGDCESC